MVQMEQKINKRMKSSLLLTVHSQKKRSSTGLMRITHQASISSLSPDKGMNSKKQASPPKRAQSQVFQFKKNLKSSILQKVHAKLSSQQVDSPSPAATDLKSSNQMSPNGAVNLGIFLNSQLNQGQISGVANNSANAKPIAENIEEQKEEDEEEDSLTEEGMSGAEAITSKRTGGLAQDSRPIEMNYSPLQHSINEIKDHLCADSLSNSISSSKVSPRL